MSKHKHKYRIRNWRAYNAALVERGSLTVWFDEAHRGRWYETERNGTASVGRRVGTRTLPCSVGG